MLGGIHRKLLVTVTLLFLTETGTRCRAENHFPLVSLPDWRTNSEYVTQCFSNSSLCDWTWNPLRVSATEKVAIEVLESGPLGLEGEACLEFWYLAPITAKGSELRTLLRSSTGLEEIWTSPAIPRDFWRQVFVPLNIIEPGTQVVFQVAAEVSVEEHVTFDRIGVRRGSCGEQCESGTELWTDMSALCHCSFGQLLCSPTQCPQGQICGPQRGGSSEISASGACTIHSNTDCSTFDGVLFRFMAPCTFTLARTCSPTEAMPAFTVELVAEQDGNSSLPIIQEVLVEIPNFRVSLMKRETKRVVVNGVWRKLPLKLSDTVNLKSNPAAVILETTFGLYVSYDIIGSVNIKLPPNYSDKVCGLCGNFNHVREDDFRKPDGPQAHDATSLAESWQSRQPISFCETILVPHQCDPLEEAEYASELYCGGLLSSTGSFAECLLVLEAQSYFRGCVDGMCSSHGDLAVLCETLQVYAYICQEAGVAIHTWRNSTLCPFQCGENSHYNPCADGCPDVCTSMDATGSCGSCVERCECDSGFKLSGEKCVPAEDCGCWYQGELYEKGESWLQGECVQQCQCTGSGIVQCTTMQCPETEICKVKDGLKGCFPLNITTCRVYGDPHYITFDEMVYDFQGGCSYTLITTCGEGSSIQFTVIGHNMHPPLQNLTRSKLEAVTLQIDDLNLTLNESREINVNGSIIQLPYSNKGPYGSVWVYVKGSYIILETTFGLRMKMDGQNRLFLQVDERYKNELCGLCGTFSGYQDDDFVMPGGQNATGSFEFGDSWRVQDNKECVAIPNDPTLCDSDDMNEAYQKCNTLLWDAFKPCHELVHPTLYISSCVYDYCATNSDQHTLCESLKSYVAACQVAGVELQHWQTDTACADLPTTSAPSTTPTPTSPTPDQTYCPINCDFERNLCGWEQLVQDSFDWTKHSGPTPSNLTGPTQDHTTGAGFYMYIEGNSVTHGDSARLLSSVCHYTGPLCVQFWYHMYGSAKAMALNIYMLKDNSATKIWAMKNNQGPKWHPQYVDIGVPGPFQIIVEGIRGSNVQSDVAIDDISIQFGSCSDNIHDRVKGTELRSTTAGALPSHTVCQLDCSFEQDLCKWNNLLTDVFDWTRLRGSTSTVMTGPSSDHNSGDGYYLYIEGNSGTHGDTARLLSSECSDSGPQCLQFWYHMYGSADTMGLNVYLLQNKLANSLWLKRNNQGNTWQLAEVDFTTTGAFQIIFEGRRGSNEESDVSIDDVKLFSGRCSDISGAVTRPPRPEGNTTAPPTVHVPTTTAPEHPLVNVTVHFPDTSHLPVANVTLPPVVEATTYFIDKDNSTEVPDKIPPPHKVCQLDCSFEQDLCKWNNLLTDVFDWTRLRGSTSTVMTGPSSDHTSGDGYYLYIEGNSGTHGDTARLLSSECSDSGPQCLQFWYHMYGSADTMGLNVYLLQNKLANSLWLKRNNQGNTWQLAEVDFTTTGAFQIIFEGRRGSNEESDVSIDDVKLFSGRCSDISGAVTRPPRPEGNTTAPPTVHVPTTTAPEHPLVNVTVHFPDTSHLPVANVILPAVVEATTYFIDKDNSTDVPDKIPPPHKVCQLDCSFEQDLCKWNNLLTDVFDWTRLRGSTSTVMTGPSSDHTSGDGYYLYIEGNSGTHGDTARLLSSECSDSGPQCLQFWYHMYGSADTMGLNVYLLQNKLANSIWLKRNNQGNTWQLAEVDFTTTGAFQIIFEGRRGSNEESDVSIDDVKLFSGRCSDISGAVTRPPRPEGNTTAPPTVHVPTTTAPEHPLVNVTVHFPDTSHLPVANVTLPPAVEATTYFIDKDNSTDVPDKIPPPHKVCQLDCSFEQDLCKWNNLLTDVFDWTRLRGSTSTVMTGPSSDHTSGDGYYLYIEGNSGTHGDTARLLSSECSDSGPQCLQFWYHMYGSADTMGLNVYLLQNKLANSLWLKRNNQGNTWQLAEVDFTTTGAFQIIFEGRRGSNEESDVSIDDVKLFSGRCSDISGAVTRPPRPEGNTTAPPTVHVPTTTAPEHPLVNVTVHFPDTSHLPVANVTLPPVVEATTYFIDKDNSTEVPDKITPPHKVCQLDCSFEQDLCKWNNLLTDVFDWTRLRGSTSTVMTGPSSDHTSGDGYYLYIEGNSGTHGDTARLLSSECSDSGPQCLQFWYHMYGSADTMGLNVYLLQNKLANSLWLKRNNQGNTWQLAEVDFTTTGAFQIIFEGRRGSNEESDVSIDDVKLFSGRCSDISGAVTRPPRPEGNTTAPPTVHVPTTTAPEHPLVNVTVHFPDTSHLPVANVILPAVVEATTYFIDKDNSTDVPDKIPPPHKVCQLDCSFEQDLCKWNNLLTDVFDWTRLRGSTSTVMTGPSSDHTSGDGYYLYIEGNSGTHGDTARLLSSECSDSGPQCLQFWYHMYGSADTMGLNVYLLQNKLANSIWLKRNNQGNTWQLAEVDFTTTGAFQIIFEGRRGSNEESDVSIDDVKLFSGRCSDISGAVTRPPRPEGNTTAPPTVHVPTTTAPEHPLVNVTVHFPDTSHLPVANVTLPPVVEATTYFIDKDNSTEVPDKITPPHKVCQLDCSFEQDLCKWNNLLTDVFDWTRLRGSTSTVMTGPSSDHTSGDGYYLYIEGNSGTHGDTARLLSSECSDSGPQCLQFWYHMYGSADTMGLNVYLLQNKLANSLWLKRNNQGNTWQLAEVDFTTTGAFQIIFEGRRGSNEESDVSIDDVKLFSGRCSDISGAVTRPPRPEGNTTAPPTVHVPTTTAPEHPLVNVTVHFPDTSHLPVANVILPAVVEATTYFIDKDNSTDVPDKIPPPHKVCQLDCSFEQDLCKWNNLLTDVFDWTRLRGSTSTVMTGPSSDHTSGDGYYLYIEGNSGTHGDTARLLSSECSDSGPQCLQFWYHMYGSADTMGLNVYLLQNKLANSIWLKRNNQGNTWQLAEVDFTTTGAFQIIFEGRRGSNEESDVSIDDVKLFSGRCSDISGAVTRPPRPEGNTTAPPTVHVPTTTAPEHPLVNVTVHFPDTSHLPVANVTLPPAVEATTYFIDKDNSTDVPDKIPPPHKVCQLDCSFEQDLCKWNNLLTDVFDWTRLRGSTSTVMTGPSSDHTSGDGYYLYIEGNSGTHGDTARLLSSECSDSGPQCLQFWYHMYGSADTMGLNVYLLQNKLANSIWLKRNNQGNTWQLAEVDFTTTGAFQIIFEGRRGSNEESDVSIDDVKLFSGRCSDISGAVTRPPRPEGNTTAPPTVHVPTTTAPEHPLVNVTVHFPDTSHLPVANVTLPAVVEATTYFIDKDNSTDVPDKIPPPHKVCQLDCSFEQDLCKWNNLLTDVFDWTRLRGSTSTVMTGPSSDHTSGDGYYLYIEGNSGTHGDTARLLSSECSDSGPQCLQFWYHMYGSADTMGLNVYLLQNKLANSIWLKRNNQGNTWQLAEVDFTTTGAFQIIFEGRRGSNEESDVSIDDVKLFSGRCSDINGAVTRPPRPEGNTTAPPTVHVPTTTAPEHPLVNVTVQLPDTSHLPVANVTLPPAVEATTYFIDKDNSTEVPDKITPPHKVCQLDCSFEQDLCKWNNLLTDVFDWTRLRGSTSTVMTGPSSDHTSGDGYYLYIEGNSGTHGDTARLLSSECSDSGPQCLQFWYHMYGSADTMGLNVYLLQNKLANSLWLKRNNQGNTWQLAEVDFTTTGAFQIIFEGRRGSNDQSDVAIDDVSLHRGHCEDLVKPTILPSTTFSVVSTEGQQTSASSETHPPTPFTTIALTTTTAATDCDTQTPTIPTTALITEASNPDVLTSKPLIPATTRPTSGPETAVTQPVTTELAGFETSEQPEIEITERPETTARPEQPATSTNEPQPPATAETQPPTSAMPQSTTEARTMTTETQSPTETQPESPSTAGSKPQTSVKPQDTSALPQSTTNEPQSQTTIKPQHTSPPTQSTTAGPGFTTAIQPHSTTIRPQSTTTAISPSTTTVGPQTSLTTPSCPQNSHYNSCISACNPTCTHLHGPPHCKDSAGCVQGCVCNVDFVQKGRVCVPIQQCACLDRNGAIRQFNEVWYTNHCSQKCECEKRHGSGKIDCDDKDECDGNTVCLQNEEGNYYCQSTGLSDCTINSDAEYRTFDKLRYDFEGEHSYVLVQSRNLPDNLPDVYIEVNTRTGEGNDDDDSKHHDDSSSEEDHSRRASDENEDDDSDSHDEDSEEHEENHRFQELRIRVYNHTVELLKKRMLVVDGRRTNTPVSPSPGVNIYERFSRIYLKTDFGLSVEFDGHSTAEIILPRIYRRKVGGLCGNFDSQKKNDWMKPDGTRARSAEEFGESWRV